MNQNKPSFSFEINLIEGCNWACEYCYEGQDKITGKPHVLNQNPDKLLNAIHAILNNDWFNVTFGNMHIDFWGGEPSLNLKLMKTVMDEFKHDDRVRYFIYTNGSRIPELIETIKDFKDIETFKGNKLDIQVSYDGNPIHDLRRVDKKGRPTSQTTIEGMKLLYDNGFIFKLKSTLMKKDFKRMSAAWDDIYQLRQMFGDRITYAPTIDYYSYDLNEQYLKDLEKSMLEICEKEYHFYKKEGTFLFTWLTTGAYKRLCGSGKCMAAVDIDGKVYFCHGAIYSGNNTELQFADIFDTAKLIEGIKKNHERLTYFVYDDECERCVATACLRCSITKYFNSNKNSFIDKFYDLKCQTDLCEYYKLVGKVSRGLMMNIMEDI